MFPLAHAWLLEQVAESPIDAAYLGCVWPDMLVASPLSHTQSHQQGAALLAFGRALPASAAGDEFLAFLRGALSHCSEPHGFDWYSDEQWDELPREQRGYAFQHSRAIASEAARACGIAAEQGWWKAHNLVEMAFERGFYSERPALGERLAAVCADSALIERIATLLGQHFGVAAHELAAAMARYPEYVLLRPSSLDGLAEVYAIQVRAKHPGAQPNADAVARLIGECEHLIATDRDAYLTLCVERVGAMLRERFR